MTAPKLKPCPFCGSTEIDPKGWVSTDRCGPACDDCNGSANTVEIWNTRTASIPAPGADYVALADAASRLLREAEMDGMEVKAGWDCWMGNLRAALSARPTTDTQRTGSLLDNAAINAAANPMPLSDMRVVTVAQLERLINKIEVATYWDYASDEKRNGPDPIAEEIRAIIGGQANE